MAYAPKPAGPKNLREMFHYLWRELRGIQSELETIAPGGGPTEHDDLDGVTSDQHHPQLHDLTSHTDVNAPTPTSRDGVFWNGSAYANDKRMNWIFPYVPGGPWVKDDATRDGDFAGIANKDTTEPLGPIPTGVPFWPTDGAAGLFINDFQLLGVKVGNQYTMAQDGVIDAARINIPLENVALLVTASLHVNNVQVVETTYVPRTSGEHFYNIAPFFVFVGDVVRIEMDVVKQTGNTQVHYLEAPAYWATYSDPMFSTVQGLFDEVPNTSAYDLDLEFQTATVSTDWDIIAATGSSIAAAGVEEAPIDGTPYVRQDGAWIPLPP